jgi:hypothetical protein
VSVNVAELGLVVPVRLDALLVGAGDARDDRFFPPLARFDRLPFKGGPRKPNLASEALAKPFTGNAPMPQGIHLHWHLPAALRRGAYDEAGRLEVPRAPDRWLLTRVLVRQAGSKAPSASLRSWVVESDHLAADGRYSETTVLRTPDGSNPRSFAFLGRVYDYEDWLRDGNRGTYADSLTALGFGIPDFSSYYPNCRNVFGLHDASLDTEDMRDVTLAYAVTGWYRRPENDPLHDHPLDGKQNELGWLFEAGPGEVPAYSLFHGVVHHLPWDPSRTYFPDFDVAINPDVAVGNTPAEAFSALAAKRLEGQPFQYVERVLNALQLGLLKGLGAPDGLAQLEEGIFDASLSSVQAGVQWEVRARPGAVADPTRDPLADVPYDVGNNLAELNAAQRELDRQRTVVTSLRGQIFADWQKYMEIAYGAPGPGPSLNEVYSFVTAEARKLTELEAVAGQLAARVASLEDAIRPRLPAEAELVDSAAPRYYAPNDPVLVLSGDGVPPPPPDDAAEIRCVLTSRIPRSVELPAGLVPGSAAVSLAASALPGIPRRDELPHPVVADLVQAELLLATESVGVPTAAVAAEGGAGNPAVLDFAATATALAAAQRELLAGQKPPSGIAFEGRPPQPDIAFQEWLAEPWHPIALSWRFDLYPLEAIAAAGGNYPARFVLDNFDFDDASLDYRLRAQRFSSTFQEYAGTILLSPDASISLQREIEDYIRYEEDPELKAILERLRGMGVLAQALGGFEASLLMLGEALQLPIHDPLAPSPAYAYFSNDLVRRSVGDQNRYSPLPTNAYSPLRAGKIVLRRIVLTDGFGRFRSVNLSKLAISETIPTARDDPRAMLPPLRVAEASQVSFRWLAAANPALEATALPATSPICGWVVPNNLDSSLMFYAGSGEAIGTMTPSGDGAVVVWQDAPGTGVPTGSPERAFQGRNPVLAAFALRVVALGGAYLKALVRTFDDTQTFVAPQGYRQDRQTATLVGTPLVLVQAALDMTLAGLPSPDQSYEALRRDIQRGDPLDRSVWSFPKVEFPLLLGSLSKLDDGLVGFFRETDFDRFYAAAADGTNPHVVRPAPDTVTLAPGAAPRTLTMLVDPRCKVHAFNGVTRVKALDIPVTLYAGALAALSYTFLTSPVLAGAGPFAIPVPLESDRRWTWVTYDGVAWRETDIAPVNAQANVETPQQIVEGWLKLTRKGRTSP